MVYGSHFPFGNNIFLFFCFSVFGGDSLEEVIAGTVSIYYPSAHISFFSNITYIRRSSFEAFASTPTILTFIVYRTSPLSQRLPFNYENSSQASCLG